MSFLMFYIRTGFILSIIFVNVASQRCRDSIYCTESIYYWCCDNSQQCGMNLGTCFSQNAMDRLLIIAGSIGGVLMLCCLVSIGYCIRSSHIKEREAEKMRNHWPRQLHTSVQVTHPYVTTPISFANQIPLQVMSPVNVVSQSNNAASVPAQTSTTHQSPEYQQIMKYLTTTDQLLRRDTINDSESEIKSTLKISDGKI